MGITSATNKRRRTPLIDNVLIRNFIYTTLLTFKYNKEAYALLKKETETRRHVLAGKYFDSPAKFHDAIRHFFEVDYVNHKSNLSSLLTLKFQSFQNAHLLCA